MDRGAKPRAVVTGAGGFIGHHLVRRLKSEGYWVRGVDQKLPEFEPTLADEFVRVDLREFEDCERAVRGVEDVYQLAADMGGIGYITADHAQLSRNNILINSHMLEASRRADVRRYFYSSSACVYPSHLQSVAGNQVLRESDAVPADPEKGYGWEKLFAEKLTGYFGEECGLDVRIARFHNIYGPLTAYEGGREKAPAAICRKVAAASSGDSIPVWGDGEATRSFCYIDDCVEGIRRIMESGYQKPLNLGSTELVTVNQLVDVVAEIAGKRLIKQHELERPQGVRGRNSENTLLRSVVGWEPSTDLRTGLRTLYSWVWRELEPRGLARPPVPSSSESTPTGVGAGLAPPVMPARR